MSIRPIDMQGMVRNSSNNHMNSSVNQQHARFADVKAHQQEIDQQAEALTHKAEKPAEEKKKLNKDGSNGSNKEKQERRNRRKKREIEAEATEKTKSTSSTKKGNGRSMFDVSI